MKYNRGEKITLGGATLGQLRVQWLPERMVTAGWRAFDLHVHTKLSKSEPFSLKRILGLVRQGRKIGLDGFAVTEHFHSLNFWDIYTTLEKAFPKRHGLLEPAPGFFLVPGAEVTLQEQADVVVIGAVEDLRQLDSRFNPGLAQGYHPSFEELVGTAGDLRLVLIGAHMFRPQKSLARLGESYLLRLSALEANGRDFAYTEKLLKQAAILDLPVVGGSDAHHSWQLGVRATLVPLEEVSLAGLQEAIRQHQTGIAGLPAASWRVNCAAWYKKVVKWQRRWRPAWGT